MFYIAYFVYIVASKSDSREPIAGGLVLIATLPLLLIAKREKFAEIAAIGAYYLLVVGVISQLVSFARERNKDDELSKAEKEMLEKQLRWHHGKW